MKLFYFLFYLDIPKNNLPTYKIIIFKTDEHTSIGRYLTTIST